MQATTPYQAHGMKADALVKPDGMYEKVGEPRTPVPGRERCTAPYCHVWAANRKASADVQPPPVSIKKSDAVRELQGQPLPEARRRR